MFVLTLTALLQTLSFLSFAQQTHEEPIKANYTFQIIASPNQTWGYDIYRNNQLTIHQPSVPGLPGNQGFKTKEDAEKVAGLVIRKMKKGEMPPTITRDEIETVECNSINHWP